jgi:DNA-directed RNA polymerase specialized sigma24 family protein
VRLPRRADVPERLAGSPAPDGRRDDEFLSLNEALHQLTAADPQAAELVKLRHFAGMNLPDIASTLGIAPRTADRVWAYARAWLHTAIGEAGE